MDLNFFKKGKCILWCLFLNEIMKGFKDLFTNLIYSTSNLQGNV